MPELFSFFIQRSLSQRQQLIAFDLVSAPGNQRKLPAGVLVYLVDPFHLITRLCLQQGVGRSGPIG